MRGTNGKPGWFWLFLLEGLLTCVIAFVVSSFPIFTNSGALLTMSSSRSCTFPLLQPPPRAFSSANPGSQNAKRSSW